MKFFEKSCRLRAEKIQAESVKNTNINAFTKRILSDNIRAPGSAASGAANRRVE